MPRARRAARATPLARLRASRSAPCSRLLGALLSLGCFEAKHIVFTSGRELQDASAPLLPAPAAPALDAGAPEPDPPPSAPAADASAGPPPPDASPPDASSPDASSPDTAVPPAPCDLPPSGEPGAVLFSGALVAGACSDRLDPPYETSWYAYQESDDPLAVSQAALAPGCEPGTCSLRAQGPVAGSPAFAASGAGVGFPVAPPDEPLDASRFSGLSLWARGEIDGTRGEGGSEAPQTLFIQVVTSTDRPGDAFGAYCTIAPLEWTLCRAEFAAMRRDGTLAEPDPESDVLDIDSLLRVEVELRLYRNAEGVAPRPVEFDLELAAISFF